VYLRTTSASQRFIEVVQDNVTFGLQSKADELYINTSVCLAKFFIHKCRIVKSSPKFVVVFFLMNLNCI